MPTLIEKYDDISRSDILTNENIIKAIFLELVPEADLSEYSTLMNLVVRPAAAFHAMNQTEIGELLNKYSLQALSDGLLSSTDIDTLLANYLVTRNTGSQATGTVTLYFDDLKFVAVPESTRFTASSVEFKPSLSYNLVTKSSFVNTSRDILLVQQSDGTYAATINLTAVNNGVNGNISINTTLTADGTLQGLNKVVAASDFTGGADDETDAELAARAETGIATTSLASRPSIKKLIQDTYTNVTDVSVIGAGDDEMIRGNHNAFGIITGCYVDVVARTAARPVIETVTATAVVTDKSRGLHDVFLDRSVKPGWYRVKAVRRIQSDDPDQAELTVKQITRSYDNSLPSGADIVPTLDTVAATYTRYQTATIQFEDLRTASDPALSDDSTFSVELDIEGMPSLDTVNDYILDRDIRHPAADYLVRAPIPCFVSLGITITTPAGYATPDADAVAQAAADTVNAIAMESDRLPIAAVIAAIQGVIPTNSNLVTPITISGEIYAIDGSTRMIYGPDDLIIPSLPDIMTTPRTTAFYLNPDDVDVTLVAS